MSYGACQSAWSRKRSRGEASKCLIGQCGAVNDIVVWIPEGMLPDTQQKYECCTNVYQQSLSALIAKIDCRAFQYMLGFAHAQ